MLLISLSPSAMNFLTKLVIKHKKRYILYIRFKNCHSSIFRKNRNYKNLNFKENAYNMLRQGSFLFSKDLLQSS